MISSFFLGEKFALEKLVRVLPWLEFRNPEPGEWPEAWDSDFAHVGLSSFISPVEKVPPFIGFICVHLQVVSLAKWNVTRCEV